MSSAIPTTGRQRWSAAEAIGGTLNRGPWSLAGGSAADVGRWRITAKVLVGSVVVDDMRLLVRPKIKPDNLFLLTDGGVAWVDHGWADGLGGGHPCHHIRGELRADGDRWLLSTDDEYLLDRTGGEPIVISFPTDGDAQGQPDGDRDEARELLIQDQGVILAPD